MRRVRSYLAGLLIVSVSLLALPGAFLHDCSHSAHHIDAHAGHDTGHDTGHGDAQLDHGNCTVCDLSAPALTSALQDLDFSRVVHPVPYAVWQANAPVALWRADAPSRAPPRA